MNPADTALHAKLRQPIDDARASLAAKATATSDDAPAIGDLYLLGETAALGVEWLLIAPHPEDPTRLLAVPADTLPLAGTRDLEISDRLILRCAHPVWLPVWHLPAASRTRRLGAEIAAGACVHEAAVRAGEAPQWSDLVEVDADPEYRAREEALERGRHCLINVLAWKQPIYQKVLTEMALRLYLNGIDGESGRYLEAPMPLVAVAVRARGEIGDPSVRRLLDQVHMNHRQAFLGLPTGADPLDLAQTGWGVVLPAGASGDLREALAPLIEHRRQAAGDRFRVLEYRAGETWREWLARHGVAAGEVDPRRVPYYLLLVGSPTEIPYDFEQVLGIEYAVGRLSFDHAPDDQDVIESYRRYARSVVRQETSTLQQTPEAVFFAPRHPDDPLTLLTAEQLMPALMEDLEGFTPTRLWGKSATRDALRDALSKPAPRLLVAAAHGVGHASGHPLRRERQGALICQGWTGGKVGDEDLFSAATLDHDARVEGTVALFFASFGAGTPAPEAFMARLPQRLLSHPGGSALAVIGLADRAWGYALAAVAETSTRPLRQVIERLTAGKPVGYAAQAFNESHAAVAVDLDKMLEKTRFGGTVDSGKLVRAWVERNHSQSWVVVGDPAVRLQRSLR